MTAPDVDQSFLCMNAGAAQMDRYWAEGWRHFGILFFRYRSAVHHDTTVSVLPLRIDLRRFEPTRGQKRVLAKNRNARTEIHPAVVDETRHALFFKHLSRYRENVPSSIYDFMSPLPASVPCVNYEVCIYLDDQLSGVTYLDVGRAASSAVYAMFDPAQAKRSLGILMMLKSIEFSLNRGCRYYYPGYAYRERSAYDYKKSFTGLEYLDWTAGWKPYARD